MSEMPKVLWIEPPTEPELGMFVGTSCEENSSEKATPYFSREEVRARIRAGMRESAGVLRDQMLTSDELINQLFPDLIGEKGGE